VGIGANIRLTTADGRTQWNEITTAVGYACSSDPRVHFGLGANPLIKEIEVIWPSGTRQVMHNVAADRVFTVEETKE